ncbi:MAG: NAD-dependent epimerase/dehydratase family protein [Candidatus Aminicenantes bacterium]|nr:NAD-dependent epimerase/dehydratase family protein [Candidatus Aminicenantes bacterium]
MEKIFPSRVPKNSRCLITGASGFIGSHLAAALAAAGNEVACLVRSSSRTDFLSSLPVRLVSGDCRDRGSLRAAVSGADYIFHLAGAISAVDRKTYFDVNAGGTKNLVEACLEWNPALRRLVYVSSIAAAGPSPRGHSVSETAECSPVSDYGRSKLEAELVVRGIGNALPWVIVRPPNVLGPRQKELDESIELLRLRIRPLVGRKSSRTSIIGVWDLVRALLLVAGDDRAIGRTYFVTDGTPVSWRDITAAVARAAGMSGFYLPVPFPVQYAAAAVAEWIARWRKRTPPFTREHVVAARKHDWVYDPGAILSDLGFRGEMDLTGVAAQTIAARSHKGTGVTVQLERTNGHG